MQVTSLRPVFARREAAVEDCRAISSRHSSKSGGGSPRSAGDGGLTCDNASYDSASHSVFCIRCVAQSAEHPPLPRLRRTGRPAVVVTFSMAARVWVVPARDAVNVEGRVQIPLAAPILHVTEDKLAESPACRAGDSGGSTRRSRHLLFGRLVKQDHVWPTPRSRRCDSFTAYHPPSLSDSESYGEMSRRSS